MKLNELIQALPERAINLADGSTGEIEISGLTADSRTVEPGNLFFALHGTKTDGAKYAADAALKGAVAVISDSDEGLEECGLPVLIASDSRQALARSAAAFYGLQPRVMGAVTGTAGKTSVASFLRQIWTSAGEQAASIGTTGVVAPGREEYGSLTTPDPVALHKLLAELENPKTLNVNDAQKALVEAVCTAAVTRATWFCRPATTVSTTATSTS